MGGGGVIALASDVAFERATAGADVLLVAFGAPWCAHSGELSGVLREATGLLEEANFTSVLAELDCDQAASSCRAWVEEGRYPTLRLFRSGAVAATYTGARTAPAIAKFVAAQFTGGSALLPAQALSALAALKLPALANAVGAAVLALAGSDAIQRCCTCLAIFGCVWACWLFWGFVLGPVAAAAAALAIVGSVLLCVPARPLFGGSAQGASREPVLERRPQPEPEPEPRFEPEPEPEPEPRLRSEPKPAFDAAKDMFGETSEPEPAAQQPAALPEAVPPTTKRQRPQPEPEPEPC